MIFQGIVAYFVKLGVTLLFGTELLRCCRVLWGTILSGGQQRTSFFFLFNVCVSLCINLRPLSVEPFRADQIREEQLLQVNANL